MVGIDVFLSESKESLVSTTNAASCRAIKPWLVCQTGPGEWVYLI